MNLLSSFIWLELMQLHVLHQILVYGILQMQDKHGHNHLFLVVCLSQYIWILWVSSSYYTTNFALSSNDAADLEAAYTLVHTLNINSSDNINAVMSSPDVINLQNSLGQFSQYSTNLNNARNNLVYKLGLAGFKMTFDPNFK